MRESDAGGERSGRKKRAEGESGGRGRSKQRKRWNERGVVRKRKRRCGMVVAKTEDKD